MNAYFWNVEPETLFIYMTALPIPTLNIPQAPIAIPHVRFDEIINMVPVPPPPPPEIKEIVLRPWQIEWAQRAFAILLACHGYIDTSRMGCGKTFVLLWLAKQFGFSILIVCPVIAMEMWRQTAAEYGVNVIDIISYQSLRSIKDHQPKHGYLHRHDITTEDGKHQVSFTPTPGYLDLVTRGIMVVCDEIQFIKNNSDQYKACHALIQPIVTGGGLSRFALLSATLFNKEKHAINLLKLIGYIRAYRLYTRRNGRTILEGAQELIDTCRQTNPTETDRILGITSARPDQIVHLCYTLYKEIVKPNISGAMPTPTTITGDFDIKNGLFTITPPHDVELSNGLYMLRKALKMNDDLVYHPEDPDINWGKVTLALVAIENAKAADMARAAIRILNQNPNNKVIISVNYTTTLQQIATLTAAYQPLILNGQIPIKKRGSIIRAFNTNLAKRLLIMNTAVGGMGISLHDTVGNAPRFMLISPGFKMLELIQAAGRIYRDGTLSNAVVRIFYGANGLMEVNILDALARGSHVLRGTLHAEVTQDVILPADYASEIMA